jgi:beta-glucosidase
VWHPSAPLRSIRLRAPEARIGFDAGDDAARAAALARQSEVAIVFATQFTHEGNDVPSLALPDGQDKLIETVAQANPRTIVVLETGGPVAMPWIAHVPSVLEAWYPGIRGGEAITSILFGDVNPSGKLAVTFPVSDADLPHPRQAVPASGVPGPLDGIIQPKPPFDVKYDEALKVGYKWFDAETKAPLFPFGFGLSYTTFTYSELQVEPGKLMSVKFRVKNTGQRAGAEVAQVYLQFPETAGEPPKRLVGWSKVQLQPGESRELTIYVEPLYLSIFDTESNGWKVVPGTYKVAAGGSSATLPLQASVNLPVQANVTLQ